MAPKGGRTSLLLLLLFLLVPAVSAWLWPQCFARSPHFKETLSSHFKDKVKSLMMRCQQMGHRVPMMTMDMDNPSNASGLPMEKSVGCISPHRTFFSLLSSLPRRDEETDGTAPRLHLQTNRTMELPDPEPEWNVMSHSSTLPDLIKFMRNSSEGRRCFLRAFAAPLSWAALTRGGDELDPEDYGRLVWAAKPLLQNMAPRELGLPPSIQAPHLTQMMKMMREVFGSLSEDQQDQVRQWVKERISQNHHNCSLAVWRGRPREKPSPQPGKPPGHPLLPGKPTGHPLLPGKPTGHPLLPGKPLGHPLLPGKPTGHPLLPGKPTGHTLLSGKPPRHPLLSGKPLGDSLKPGKPQQLSEKDRNEEEESGNSSEKEGVREEESDKKRPGSKPDRERDRDGREEKKGRKERSIKRVGEGRQREEFSDQREDAGRERERESQEPSAGKPHEERTRDERWRDGERGGEGDMLRPRCPRKLMWLRTEVMKMMGPFLTRLPVDDMESIPKDQLCPFFPTPEFSSSFRGGGVVRPRLGRKFLRMVKECSHDRQELPNNLNRLGSLACFYDDVPPLNSNLSLQLLSQLDNCSNSGVATLRKRLVKTVMSSSGDATSAGVLRELGVGVTALSPAHLARFPPSALQERLASLGSRLKWSLSQAKSLAKRLLRGEEAASRQVLMSLGSAVRGVASKVLRKVKPEGLLGSASLQSMSQKMSKLQKTALLEGLRGGVNTSELVNKLPAALLSRLSLTTLDQANLTSVDQLQGKSWTLAQSAFLVRKILGNVVRSGDLRKLGSAIKGVACEAIDRVSESDVMEMAQSLTETPRWLTKTQVCCAARKLFASLENKRAGYFNDITEEELDQIPTTLLLHLSPMKTEGLPDSVCAALLDKMAVANLSGLSLRSRSRSALTNRTLRCLLNGTNMAELSSEKVLMLGSLLCELSPSQLSLLNPEALNSTLQALASCTQIPPRHRRALVQLVKQTYGDPSDWSVDTMESLGPLLLLDNSTVRTLPYKPWLKATLSDMMDSMPRPPNPPPPQDFSSGPDLSALRWKLFSLSTSTSSSTSSSSSFSNTTSFNSTSSSISTSSSSSFSSSSSSSSFSSSSNSSSNSSSSSSTSSTVVPARRKREVVTTQGELVPLVSQIEDLGEANVYWSPAQLSMMPNDTFIATVETLGAIADYSPEQLSVLRQKTIEAFGPVAGLNEDLVLQVRCISQGFSLAELSSLPVSSLDTLETLATCSWTQSQREALWEAFAERAGVTAGGLGALEMVGLDQFICGLGPNASAHLDTEAFREAVGSVGQVQCPLVVTERLKDCAVAVFGHPCNWTQAQVNTLGNIMAGLSTSELRSLSSSVLSFLSQTSIPLIPAERLAALSVSQLEALGPDNAAMVTEAQRQRLSAEQIVVLDNALGVPTTRVEQPTQPPANANLPPQQQSGASTLGTVGIGVFVQPFLLLLLMLVL